VRFESPERIVDIPTENNELSLAYAITVHKYQGSESPAIIIPVHSCMGGFLMNKNMIYTAISRAKNLCVIVGDSEALFKAAKRKSIQKRFTNLNFFLKESFKL